MSDLVLSKESSNEELMLYFNKVHELQNVSETEFIVDLDDVWPLVYSEKSKALRALTTSDLFVKDVDYRFFAQNGENYLPGRPSNKYMITVPCMEYLVARRDRRVFEIYRQVFHKTANMLGAWAGIDPSRLPDLDSAIIAIMDKFPNMPQSYGEALVEAGKFFNEKESLKNKCNELQDRMNVAERNMKLYRDAVVANEHKVAFYDNVLRGMDGIVTLDEAAKHLTAFGLNIPYKKFSEFLREIKFIVEGKSGRLSPSANSIRKGYATYRVIESYAFGKKIPCNMMMTTDKGLRNLVEAIKGGKLTDTFLKYGVIINEEEDGSPY